MSRFLVSIMWNELASAYVTMQSFCCIFTTKMRVYLQSKQLGQALAKGLAQKGKTQKDAAKDLKITQGQISHFLSGDFKTKKGVLLEVCKYVNINPDKFREIPAQTSEVDRAAI